MGYGFMAYAVDIEKLKQVCGSKDEKLVRMIGGRFKADIQQSDAWFGDDGPGLKALLGQIVNGEPLEDPRRFRYSYAFELLVKHFGKMLDNGALYPVRTSFVEVVDGAFARMGVSDVVTLSRLWSRGLPVELPPPDDFPSTGYMTADEVANAYARMAGAAIASDGDEEGVADAIACLRGWLSTASGLKRGLVSYYY